MADYSALDTPSGSSVHSDASSTTKRRVSFQLDSMPEPHSDEKVNKQKILQGEYSLKLPNELKSVSAYEGIRTMVDLEFRYSDESVPPRPFRTTGRSIALREMCLENTYDLPDLLGQTSKASSGTSLSSEENKEEEHQESTYSSSEEHHLFNCSTQFSGVIRSFTELFVEFESSIYDEGEFLVSCEETSTGQEGQETPKCTFFDDDSSSSESGAPHQQVGRTTPKLRHDSSTDDDSRSSESGAPHQQVGGTPPKLRHDSHTDSDDFILTYMLPAEDSSEDSLSSLLSTSSDDTVASTDDEEDPNEPFIRLYETVNDIVDYYRHNYVAFSTVYKWRHPEKFRRKPCIRLTNRSYGGRSDTKYRSKRIVKKLISGEKGSLKKVKATYKPRGVKYDPLESVVLPKVRSKLSQQLEYLPYFIKPTLKRLCPELIGYGIENKRKFYVRMVKRLLLEDSLVKQENTVSRTVQNLFERKHLNWLMFATELYFHLKLDRGWESIEARILKLFGYIKFFNDNEKNIEVDENLWKELNRVCDESLQAMLKLFDCSMKKRYVDIKCQSSKFYNPYPINMVVTRPCEIEKKRKDSRCKSVRKDPYDDGTLGQTLKTIGGKSDIMFHKRMLRSVEDDHAREILSKYELSRFICHGREDVKMQLDFRRIKNDVMNMWDAEGNNTATIIQQQVDTALMYWNEKRLLTRNIMGDIQTQLKNMSIATDNLQGNLPPVVFDSDNSLKLEAETIWNGKTKEWIAEGDDDEWEDEEDNSSNEKSSRTSPRKRKDRKKAKILNFMQCCKVMHTHAALSIFNKLETECKINVPATKWFVYSPPCLRGGLQEIEGDIGNVCPLGGTEETGCHCTIHAAPGIILHRMPTTLSKIEGADVTPFGQEILFKYFGAVKQFEQTLMKREISTRFSEDSVDSDFLHPKIGYYCDLLEYLRHETLPMVTTQIRELLDHQKMCMKFKGRRNLAFKFCKDIFRYGIHDVVGDMSTEQVKEFSSLPGHLFDSYILVTPEVVQERKKMIKKLVVDLHEIFQVKSSQMFKELQARDFFRGLRNVCSFDDWRQTDDCLVAKMDLQFSPIRENEGQQESEESPNISMTELSQQEQVEETKSPSDTETKTPSDIIEVLSRSQVMTRVSVSPGEMDVLTNEKPWFYEHDIPPYSESNLCLSAERSDMDLLRESPSRRRSREHKRSRREKSESNTKKRRRKISREKSLIDVVGPKNVRKVSYPEAGYFYGS